MSVNTTGVAPHARAQAAASAAKCQGSSAASTITVVGGSTGIAHPATADEQEQV